MKITKTQLAQIIKEELNNTMLTDSPKKSSSRWDSYLNESRTVLTEEEKSELLQELNFFKNLAAKARGGKKFGSGVTHGWEAQVAEFEKEDEKAREMAAKLGLDDINNEKDLVDRLATLVAAANKSGDEELKAAAVDLAQDGAAIVGGEEEAESNVVPLFKGDDALYSKLYSSIKSLLAASEYPEAAKNKQGLQTMVKSILKDLSSQLRANDIQVSEGQVSEKVTPTFRPVKGAEKGMSFNYTSAYGVKTAVKVVDPAKEGDKWKGVKTMAQIIDPETCKPKGTGAARALTPDRVGAPIPQCSPKTARSMERGGAATMSPTDVGGRIKPTKGQIKSGQAIAGKIHKLISDTYGGNPRDLEDIQKSTQKLVTTVIVKLVKPFLSKYLKGKDIQLKEDKFNDLALSLTEIMLVETLDASSGKNMMPKVSKALTEGYKAYKRDDISGFELGRQDALAVSQGEMAKEDTYLKRLRDEAYGAGFDDAMKKLDPQLNWDDEGGFDNDDMYENKITKSKLAQIVQEELAAVTLQEAPLPADEYEDTVEYLWSQNLSDIVLPFKHATSLDGEFPPAIKTIVDYWEKKDFKGMASEWLDLRDELDDWLESRGFNWSIRTEEDPGSRYVDYSIPNGKKGRMPRNVIYTNFRHAFRLIRMLIDSTPPDRGYTGFGVGNDPTFVKQQAIDADTLGRRPQQEHKITKSQLAQIIKEELKATLSEYSDTEYDPYWDEQAYDDARDEALRSAIDELLVELEDTPVPLDELIPSAPEDFDARDEKEWIEDGEEYLLGLVKAGDVVRVEGSADMPNLYVLAQ